MRKQIQMTRLITVAALCRRGRLRAGDAEEIGPDRDDCRDKTCARPGYRSAEGCREERRTGPGAIRINRAGSGYTSHTPFGILKTDVTDTENRPAPPPSAATKVIDKGDTVRFEQSGPFGPIAWEKKKSDLTDQERQVLDAQNPNQNQNQTQTAQPDAK